MNELQIFEVNTNNDQLTVSARDLFEFIGLEERFSRWWNRMVSYGYEENVDYTPYQKVHPLNQQKIQDYEITLDMAKQLAMLQRNEKGMLAREYFIEVEKEWNSPEKIMARALRLADKKIGHLNAQILEMKPKVDFYNAVAGSKTAIEMDKVAKVLGIRGYGRNNLFKFLRDKKVLQQNNIPYQTYVDRGYFRVVEQRFNKPNGEVCINLKTLVYQKGINFIRKLIQDD